MSSYLRIDGGETPLVAARLTWQRAAGDDRPGLLFHVAAHGGRRIVHLTAWAPGRDVADLSHQTLVLGTPGCDAALDGRFFVTVTIRFGRVTAGRAILSLDGTVESLDPRDEARAVVESDLRCDVAPTTERRHCLRCGGGLGASAGERTEFVGGRRVRLRSTPALCAACADHVEPPRRCPTCGSALDAADVSTWSDGSALDYWATCPNGHATSGTLGVPAGRETT